MTSNHTRPQPWKWLIDYAAVWLLFLLGAWLVVLRPLGAHFSLVPGDLGDARFNNYVLEHFLLWIRRLVPSYWNASFFYPYLGTMAFSDNLLGSAPLYALFRLMGLDMPSAFQAWYAVGMLLNFAAAAFVLARLALKPLAVAIGAYFFAFGMPLLAQENHAQLIYHFCIPLACYALWRFYRKPRLWLIAVLVGLVTWQFYFTVYMGVFLVMLLVVMFLLLPWFVGLKRFRQRLALWPRRFEQAWQRAGTTQRILSFAAILALAAGFLVLILPYYRVVRLYGFKRNIIEVMSLLPRLKSYFLADHSLLWGRLSDLITVVPYRWEHQLFVGLAAVLLIITGLVLRFRTRSSRLARLNLRMALVLAVITFMVNGLSLYWLIWWLPGVNSLRAVTRVILVIMWSLAVYIAWVIDGLLRQASRGRRWLLLPIALLCVLLVAEPALYVHTTYLKVDFQARMDALQRHLPATLPADPILFVANEPRQPFWLTEVDGMLFAQQMGWPTLNGYSGNTPPGYMFADSCKQLPLRIEGYMQFAGITDPQFYLQMMQRAVPVGFSDCDPAWWQQMP